MLQKVFNSKADKYVWVIEFIQKRLNYVVLCFDEKDRKVLRQNLVDDNVENRIVMRLTVMGFFEKSHNENLTEELINVINSELEFIYD